MAANGPYTATSGPAPPVRCPAVFGASRAGAVSQAVHTCGDWACLPPGLLLRFSSAHALLEKGHFPALQKSLRDAGRPFIPPPFCEPASGGSRSFLKPMRKNLCGGPAYPGAAAGGGCCSADMVQARAELGTGSRPALKGDGGQAHPAPSARHSPPDAGVLCVRGRFPMIRFLRIYSKYFPWISTAFSLAQNLGC